jgi:hypothetical protein
MPFFWETFVNDDLDAIKDTPARFGRAMRRMEEYFVTQMYANNTTYFSVAHKNVLNSSVVTGATTNAPLSSQALIYALIGISQQVDADGQPIMLDNFRLIVPPSLKPTAMNIINSTQIWFNDFGGTIASNTSQERLLVNNWLNSAVDRVAVNYQLPLIDTVHGNTGWYLFADPNNGRPAMEFGRLRIAPAPQLFMKLPNSVAIGEGQFGPGSGPGAGTTNQSPMEGDFDTDSINYKIRHVFGGTLMDPVMGFYSNGSGS